MTVLDAKIEGTDVAELVASVKAIPELSETAFVMLVPLGQQVDFSWLQSIGVADYVTKPVMPSEMFDTLVKVIAAGKDG